METGKRATGVSYGDDHGEDVPNRRVRFGGGAESCAIAGFCCDLVLTTDGIDT